jgi:endonuclease-8
MSKEWDESKAVLALEDRAEQMVCDVLLDQDVFAGVGNIIKNEVLHRLHIHPLTLVGTLTHRKQLELIRETQKYCFQFYEWKKNYELKKHWQVYRQRQCAICETKPMFAKTGKLQRVSFVCLECQPEPAAADKRMQMARSSRMRKAA